MNSIQFKFTQKNNPYRIISTSHYSPQLHSLTLVTLLEKPRVYRGYMNGYHQPVAHLTLQVLSFDPAQMIVLHHAMEEYFEIKFNPIFTENDFVSCLGEVVCAIQKTAGLPVFQPIQIDVISNDNHQYAIWIPVLHEHCFHQAMAFMLQFVAHHLAASSFIHNDALANEIKDLIRSLQRDAPKGVNSLRLLNAAHCEEIPWIYLTQNIFQYGHGRHARWLDSTFTDTTSYIGAGLAKNKQCTSILLKQAGLPVPEQLMVSDEADAIEQARKLGYPVVIKPHNQERGIGVQAWIMSDAQLKKAYANAHQYSGIVLLEKHIVGKDYRLLVLNGKLIWAIERIPAGVTGDGTSNISELIEKTNQLRKQENNEQAALPQIKITEESPEFLVDQGYDFNSILPPQKFVALARISNISAGGTPVAVFDQVHPDNKRLAETAADLLRLDLAGIDLIIPDIRQSYLDTGGAIIEVNAQPQLGMITAAQMYHHILTTLVSHHGRIPIIVICSHSSEDSLIQQLHSLLSSQYKNIGMAKDNFTYINGDKMNQTTSLFNAAHALLLNTKIDALIYHIQSLEDIDYQGLPFDRYDYLFFIDKPLSHTQITKEHETILLNSLFKSCHGSPLLNENTLNALMIISYS